MKINMKYNYKLVFKDKSDAIQFAIMLIQYVQLRKDWLKAYEAMRRKNILYVYTDNYSYLNNYIESKQYSYNYTITKL